MSKSYLAASAVAVTLIFSVVPGSLLAAEATVSKANAKTLLAAMEAQKAKRCPEAISKSKEALAAPEKTSYDSYVAYGIMSYCYQVQGNNAELLTALQGKLDSGVPQGAEHTQVIKNMYAVALGLKDYNQAVELGNRLIRSGSAGPDTYEQISIAMVGQGKQADAIKFLTDYVADVEKRGQKPSEGVLLRLRDMQEKSGNSAAATSTIEKLVNLYPKADYWNSVTYQLSRDPKLTDRHKLHIYRLKMATGTLKRCPDFSEMEELAVSSGMAGESQKVIEQALATKACNGSDEERMRRHFKANGNVVAEDKAAFPKLEAAAAAAKTGEPDVAVGSQLFGFGEYAKAAEAFSRGLAKGGLKNAADVQLTLGVAQMRAGNKAEALKTFRSVKADAPAQRIATLWIWYIS